MRLLMWLALAVLVYLALRKQTQRQAKETKSQSTAAPSGGEQMLPCAVCQVFIPESEAIIRHGQAYCCNDHADRAQ
ncbi:PP0621 family protein [Undibacterium cyanobacteriorum]|uniref:PP0621 family protein n=1 Tax=Undibacterium cyanobacteriorum TaxID=3073561 RepID=A0ABY9RF83_9BURK|nr:PP0621 family protein [Undibacterium sp. 20NA77.5]WMW79883.1 PP0621 family protein [Undibacterium sp. 20NA77.5]